MQPTPSDFLHAGLSQQLEQFLVETGRAGGRWLHDLESFLGELRPQIEDNAARALAGDEAARTNLEYLADLSIIRSARLSEAFAAEELDRLKATVLGVVKGFIGLAANAVLPGSGALVGAIGAAVIPVADDTRASTDGMPPAPAPAG